jgi:hypothetical protein
MKARIIILFTLITTLFVGCKDDGKTNESTDLTKQVKVEEGLKVSLEGIIKKDDKIHLYYTEDGSIDFSKNPPMITKVVGSEVSQIVNFNFPEEVFPNEIRFDMGTNLAQEPIVLKSIKFEYKGKTRVFVGPEIGMYFRSDGSNCIFDIPTGTINGKVVDGKRLIPLLYPHEEAFRREIEKLMN